MSTKFKTKKIAIPPVRPFVSCREHYVPHGSFPPTETDSDLDSDSKPYCYIVLCTTFSTGMDSDSDPCTDSFLNGYCSHFRDGSPSQGYESESVSIGGNEPSVFNVWVSLVPWAMSNDLFNCSSKH